MREIKFKGLRIDAKQWVYGFLVTDCFDHAYIIVDFEPESMLSEKYNYFEVIPETVSQCIGEKDKNGKELFDGDKVRVTSGEYDQGYYEFDKVGILKYDGLGFDLYDGGCFYGLSNMSEFEIKKLGNIHEKKYIGE
jgi:uncharacterized phage protein (TIGR01671 family)